MKIPVSFSTKYDSFLDNLKRLKDFVAPRLSSIATELHGQYFGRIKDIESLLIKSEKEGCKNPFNNLNDLFACTVIVPNAKLINDVLKQVESEFEIVELTKRDLKPTEFDYSDVNLTLRVKPHPLLENDLILNFVFELQVKTLLQHAWSQASHDVIYKSKKKTWGLTRIASQLRALLEMADSVLANLENSAELLQEKKKLSSMKK